MNEFRAKKYESELLSIGGEIIEAIRSKLASENINASGNLSESLESTVTDYGLQIWANDYMRYAEMGRPAGKIPSDFADILEQWISDKHISVPSGLTPHRFASSIAHKIRLYGSARYRNNEPVDLITDAVEKAMPDVEDKLGQVFVATINKNLTI